ncbi:MAG TPA: glycosyltransferase, partial [Candidatus Competibacteraceae bacterium]|nr:glycosyltransferase [Candidatus Competibacteraceae bacterium]
MAADIEASAISPSSVVDVIIPVYRGLAETQRCLESVLAFPQRTACEIVVVNDCSPEPKLSAW